MGGYQAPGNPNPGYNYQGSGGYGPPPTNGKAVASMVLGIISLVFAWFGYFAILAIAMSIVGIILGIGARKDVVQGQSTGMATAGVVCSIIALALSTIVFISCVICVSNASRIVRYW